MQNIQDLIALLFTETLKPRERIKAGVNARKQIKAEMIKLEQSLKRVPKEKPPVA